MGIKQHVMLIYTKKQVQEAEKWVKSKSLPNPSEKAAVSYYDNKDAIIHVNLKDTDMASDLIDSLVHELLHLKEPKARHGKNFQDMINDIIISG